MRQFSSTLLGLAAMEEVIFLGLIWNQPAATWHSFFVVGMLVMAAGLLYCWAVERNLVRMTKIGQVALLTLFLTTGAEMVGVLGAAVLFTRP